MQKNGSRFSISDYQNSKFYQLPQFLFTVPKYKSLSDGAKLAYALLKNRFEYSVQNNWIDDEGNISGYTCLRGLNYVKQESVHPVRTLTTTVKVNSDIVRVCPVKSSDPLPKELIFDAMKEINSISVDLPIKMHQIIIKNILNTGIDIISTKELK